MLRPRSKCYAQVVFIMLYHNARVHGCFITNCVIQLIRFIHKTHVMSRFWNSFEIYWRVLIFIYVLNLYCRFRVYCQRFCSSLFHKHFYMSVNHKTHICLLFQRSSYFLQLLRSVLIYMYMLIASFLLMSYFAFRRPRPSPSLTFTYVVRFMHWCRLYVAWYGLSIVGVRSACPVQCRPYS